MKGVKRCLCQSRSWILSRLASCVVSKRHPKIVAGLEQFTSKRVDNRCRLALLTISSLELVSSTISPLSLPTSSVSRSEETDFLSFKLVSATLGPSLMPGRTLVFIQWTESDYPHSSAVAFASSILYFAFVSRLEYFFAILLPVYLVFPAYLRLQGPSAFY